MINPRKGGRQCSLPLRQGQERGPRTATHSHGRENLVSSRRRASGRCAARDYLDDGLLHGLKSLEGPRWDRSHIFQDRTQRFGLRCPRAGDRIGRGGPPRPRADMAGRGRPSAAARPRRGDTRSRRIHLTTPGISAGRLREVRTTPDRSCPRTVRRSRGSRITRSWLSLCQGTGLDCRSAGPGSDLSEELAAGVGPSRAGLCSRPHVSSRTRFLQGLGRRGPLGGVHHRTLQAHAQEDWSALGELTVAERDKPSVE
jgi:hypothetical protein